MLYTTTASPIGELLLTGDGRALCGLYIQGGRTALDVDSRWERADAPFEDARAQLDEYFAGRRTSFDLPLAPAGSPFQQRVWRTLRDIPYGETISYGEQARRAGVPSPRAVGVANGRNPISIIVPCHRVVGSTGALTGFAGGLDTKAWLLDHERRTLFGF